jgi:hypothetical protein
MATLKITITAPLPDDSRVAMFERHEIEGALLKALGGGEFESLEIASEVEEGGGLRLAPERKRTRGPGRKQAANGTAAEADEVTV